MALRVVGRTVRALVAVAVLVVLVGGVPWGLWHYIGWPLPTEVPTVSEIGVVLLGPMHSTLLLDVLACVCWIVWAGFAVDVARCARDAVHDARRPGVLAARTVRTSRSPTHAVAAVLVGAVALSILGNRTAHLLGAQPSGEQRDDTCSAAAAPTWHTPPPLSITGDQTRIDPRPVVHLSGLVGEPGRPQPEIPDSVVVRAPDPQTGIHDSLWRIADRVLGDGTRWPEIFELNEGKPQPDGGTLTRPSLIFPGEELRLPDVGPDPDVGEGPAPDPPLISSPPFTPSPQPPTGDVPALPDGTALPEATPPVPAAPPDRVVDGVPVVSAPVGPGLSWGPELYVGFGLASAISAALLVARRRHRRRYLPGSGHRDDLPVAPVIYQLRLAHLRAADADPDRAPEDDEDPQDPADAAGPTIHRTGSALIVTDDLDDLDLGDGETDAGIDSDFRETDSEQVGPTSPGLDQAARLPRTDSAGRPSPVVGTRAGRELALDLAVARGLGLVGPGAAAASRAMLIDALATWHDQRHPASVLVPDGDLVALLGPAAAAAPPAALRRTATLDDALDELDAVLLTRTDRFGRDEGPQPVIVLVAHPQPRHRARLQAILDNGSSVGIVGVLLDQWRPGVTAYVNEDGTVSATSPGAGEALHGARLFHLGETETSQLLDLLRRAQPAHPDPSEPAPPDQTSDLLDDIEPENDARPHSDTGPQGEVGPAVDEGPERDDVPGAAPNRPSRPVTDPSPWTDRDGTAEPPTGSTARSDTSAAPSRGADDTGDDLPRRDRTAVRIVVLGRPRMFWRPTSSTGDGGRVEEVEITAALQPRTRELLVFLAVHPEGVSREELADNLWPESPRGRTVSSMNSALTRLRRSLDDATQSAVPDIVEVDDGRIRLDPTMSVVDFWDFEDAIIARRAATTTEQRLDAHHRIVAAYGGALADGMTAAWIEPARESVRRTALDAVVALARELADTDPQQTLDLLETARAFDPYNESIYRSIMRLQSTLGLLDAVPRTLALLTTRLAEFGDHPDADTVALAERAARPRVRPGDAPPGSPRADRAAHPAPRAIGKRRAG